MYVFLDTTVLIDYLRGRPAVARVDAAVDRGDVPCTTPINVEEVCRGLRPAEADAAGHLFEGLHIPPIGRAEEQQAGEWRRRFAAQGTTLSQADLPDRGGGARGGGSARHRKPATLSDDGDHGRTLARWRVGRCRAWRRRTTRHPPRNRT